ncbi:MAG: hypothetical protein SGCHY_003420 [Lobulomycetales sp.]
MDTLLAEFDKTLAASADSRLVPLMDSLIDLVQSTDSPEQVQKTLRSLQEKSKVCSALTQYTSTRLSTPLCTFQRPAYFRLLFRLKTVKAIDKIRAFSPTVNNLNEIWNPDTVQDLDPIIASYLIREGRFTTFDIMMREVSEAEQSTDSSTSTLNPEEVINQRDQFKQMFAILQDLRAKKLESAIGWANQHSRTSLEFHLHRVHFVSLLSDSAASTTAGKSAAVAAALAYSRKYLQRFQAAFPDKISRLMCAILFTGRLEESPYADLLGTGQDGMWLDAISAFTRDFASMQGHSPDSPLYVAVTIGSLALPTIIKMSSVMARGAGIEWTSAGELPVEIPLSDDRRFHSVFSCPVSKEQGTEENPPMMLNCGHVLVKESLNRISKGGMSNRFKCPYCPTESTAAQAMRVYF